jgi:hypothetical protein
MVRTCVSAINPFAGLAMVLAVAGCGGAGAGTPFRADESASTQAAALRSGLTPVRLRELQLKGVLPAPIPPAVLRFNQRRQRGARPRLAFQRAAKVALWASNTNFNYLLGQDSTGRKTVTAIDLSQNDCYSPVAVKVDGAGNVWVGCELTSFSATSGALQEYSGAGSLMHRYAPSCPSGASGCASFSGYGYDSAVDSHGNVFASLNLYDMRTCNPTCSDQLGAGFEWWPKGNPSSAPHLISVGDNCSPICGVGFADVDSSGNLWFTFSGYNQSTYGFGLGEVTSPTKKPKVTIVEPIGTYGFFGGVYASAGGRTLNVVDQEALTISQYHLPLSPSGAPFNVLGPTKRNAFGIGDPVSGGFDRSEKKMAIGDAGGWFDIGKVTSNRWSAVASPNFYSGIEGAAYTPSDK